MTAAPGAPRVTLLSPYHGGSHRSWAEGLVRHCTAEISVVGLEDRHWRWRMQGAALTLARQLRGQPRPDLVLATDMLDLAAFAGLAREYLGATPMVLYMHENQLTYPLREQGSAPERSRQRQDQARFFGLINARSMAAADRVVFNSAFHQKVFFEALAELLERLPAESERDALMGLADRCQVIPVGIEVGDLALPDEQPRPPLVVWNQRWEYDKNPQGLFAALEAVAARGIDFQVALCGECHGQQPAEFQKGIAALGDRVVHQGFLPRDDYVHLLGRSRVVVSTAHHEFFGVSVVEAVVAGALPLLPRRLSYPEIITPDHVDRCLYDTPADLVARLCVELADPDSTRDVALAVAADLRRRFAWSEVAPRYDALLGASLA